MKFPHILKYIALSYCLWTASAVAGGSWVEYPEPQFHIIVVKGSGEPYRPVAYRRPKANGTWEYKVELKSFGSSPQEQAQAYEDYLEALVVNIRKTNHTELMVFIHGGMNFVSGSVKRAVELVGDDSRYISSKGYPIFICWDSPPTGYGEQTLWVRAGKTEKYGRSVGRHLYAWASLPLHLLADAGRAVTRLPAGIFEFGYNDFYSIDPRSFTEFKRMKEETGYLRGETEHKNRSILPSDKKVRVSAVQPVKKTSKNYLQDIRTVLLFPLRSLALPVVDAIGVGAWNNMLRHTDTMFDRTRPESRGRQSHTPVEDAVEQRETGAIAIFFSTLREKLRDPAGYKVTLVGHSMGAIVANRIIVSYPEFTYTNIVYLAAACSVREFQNCVIPYLSEHPASRFYGLSLHPRRESGEIAISPRSFGLDIAPRGSLLVWIDNIFGNPPSEDQRRFGIFQTAVLASHNIPPNVRKQVTLKCFPFGDDEAKDGIIGSPQHHGDFSRSPYWDPSFWEIEPPARKKAADASGPGAPPRTVSTR
jgi:pimeloyl-ACP methyl ester carboxylesterase